MHSTAFLRRSAAALPAALAGSIALTMTGPAAHAAPVQEQPTAHTEPIQLGSAVPASFAQARTVPMANVATSYTVRRGDTVTAIAIRHGLRTTDVLAWNKLHFSSVIFPGQVLRLTHPGSAVKTAKPATSSRTSYRVKAGDTVSSIAGRYGVTVADIVAANRLRSAAIIYVGQLLVVQKGAAAAQPAKAATSKPVAASKPKPAAASKPKPAASRTYTVKAGDTVSVIAGRYGVTVADIVAANKLRSAGIIYVGQRLTIQKGAGASVALPAASTGGGGASSGPAPAGSAISGARYVIRSGDTVSAIASHYHVTVAAMLKANGLTMSSIIYPGQSLKIPSLIIDGLTAEQSANVRTIVAVGRSLGVPDRGIEIALGTAMTESGLRNLNYGDRDSLGLFQQRSSTGWGTKAQILDPVSSTTAFFLGRGHATRGLLDVKGWQQLPFTKAAQAVQVSAFPNAYAPWEKPSARWLAAA
ncbi:MAG TPA: LysM peptidoglycan-binding domain-containing protein [Microbacterium sp.]|nr:LysM peptidoglycan-binding domain-containing protein [Microbacterium sp.]